MFLLEYPRMPPKMQIGLPVKLAVEKERTFRLPKIPAQRFNAQRCCRPTDQK